ncbi:nck-associated protein 5-like isoform X4 [Phyllopteryx taeniolatus]|uniref:nck-associated protein 5-like isoform X4 n=1 Tax=Phyllopteryx taeniolatus TaxID=161469 RepID=UPI002AD57E8C|nr:nck-associated protein 5-like isoform X4 [Phyllopteryx taeniolatus]
MSQFADHAVPRIRNVPLLERLAEYMDANQCIDDLLKQLEEQRCNIRREKLSVARLQREVARSKSEGTMREKLIHELEEERRLRLESEKRLREVTEESELGRAQIVSLQQQFSRLEETVQSLLQNQGVMEQTATETVDIMKAYKEKLSEEVQKQHDCPEENSPLLATQVEPESGKRPHADTSQTYDNDDRTKLLLERLKTLEERNSVLALENESQREQYERCLDEVANQVVQALVTQKDLREECLKLRTRVSDLEQQNRVLGILFQQRIKPTSELLLQKLQSRIMDLSAADLLQEPERSKAFLLSRNTDSASTEILLNGKLGLPITKCLSQLSLTAPMPVYPRSSCSSSELSLSSACSELSSGSYTWNDGRSCGKVHSSLTWDKSLSLGSSAPGNISAPLEEHTPTRRKETNILEGLRKLQRRKQRSSSSSRVSKSGYKDCMNSNEGIYTLGIKSSSKCLSKPTLVGRASVLVGKKFLYDSDDADDELVQSGHAADIPNKDNWFYCKRLSQSISDTLCSWEGKQDSGGVGDNSSGDGVETKPPTEFDSNERPEKLTSFISSCLTEGGRPSAFTRVSVLHVTPSDPEGSNCFSDMDDLEELNCDSRNLQVPLSQGTEQVETMSRDTFKPLMPQRLQRDQVRAQSADGRPEPVKTPKETNNYLSEESILAVFDAQGEPIELSPQNLTKGGGPIIGIPVIKVVDKYNELAPQEKPTRQKSTHTGNYTVLDSPEKPSEYQLRTSKTNNCRGGNSDRLSMQLTSQRKLIKPPSSRANKGHSIPPLNDSASSVAGGSKLRGCNKPSASPIRLSRGTTTELNSGNSGTPSQERTPPPPITKMSRFIKSSQSPKVVNSKLTNRSEWSKGSSPSSPRLSRSHLEYADNCEQPTRDKHCESITNKLRSPSPPPPPGRTTSLLIKPNYEGSPEAHKIGVALPSTPTTVRGPPPSYYTSLQPNMQATLPIKDKDVDMDAGYGTALAPQKLVDKTSQHLQKPSGMTPITGTPTRNTTKDYLPPTNSGFDLESENAPKSSKNVPPPYCAVRGSSLYSSFASKRGSTHEYDHQSVQKSSVNLSVSLQEAPQTKKELQNLKHVISPPSPVVTSPNSSEKGQKTRISMGFKAFLKYPPSHKRSPSLPDKQEKDHINLVSKETVTSNASSQCDSLQPAYSIDSPPKMSVTEAKGEVHWSLLEEAVNPVLTPEEGDVCDKGKRSSQLFSRSISITTKSHLKPALGMNGAKARSQSFSTNYNEKPNTNILEGPGKIRTQIITNSTERGNSLSRQSSLEVPSVGLAESPIYSPSLRPNNQNAPSERTSKLISKGEESQSTVKGQIVTSPSQEEVCSLSISEKNGLNNVCKPGQVTSHFQPPASCPCNSENLVRETGGTATSPNEEEFSSRVKTQTDSPNKPPDIEDKKNCPSACTIEEKVMMGIEENLQKCQEQEKVVVSEAKQKTGPSLANWFGFRKSKLPALTGKKADLPKGKEERKETKIGLVLGGKQTKLDKKKEKKKNHIMEAQNHSEMNNKLTSIMDHCNNQMGQIASQIQCTTAFIGKDQFVKELLGRTVGKGNLVTALPTGIATPKKHSEMKGDMKIYPDAATLLMSQKLNIRADKELHMADAAGQDRMMGSSCQMRTLDSGIGTFPLPDSVTRASGRHIPKCDSSPDGVTAELQAEPPSSSPECSQPSVKVPSRPNTSLHAPGILGHSFSDPSLTYSGSNPDAQTRLPKPAGANRTKRLSMFTLRSSGSASTEDKDDETGQKIKAKEHDISAERALRLCTYSGSSSGSDTEIELERPGMTLSPLQSSRINCSEVVTLVDPCEKTLRSGSVENSLSIMDFYQHEMFSHLEKDRRRICQCDLLHKETPFNTSCVSKEISPGKMAICPKQPGSLDVTLESFNKLNHSSLSVQKETVPDGGRLDFLCGSKVDEPASSSGFSSKAGADPAGSLSDSLYNSFSSCTSQISNDV